MKRASAYGRDGKVFFDAQAKTEAGFYVGSEPVVVVDPSDTKGLSAGLLRVLDAYRTGVPTPSRREERGQELYAAAGVGTWREFVKGAKLVDIELNDGIITLVSWRNDGRGFVPTDRKRSAPMGSPDLAATVIAALADAE